MAEGKELEPIGVEGEDYYVITKRGREIVVPIRKQLPDGSWDQPYSENPQIRAFQLVHEGRIGGDRNGANGNVGTRKKRISAAIVEEAQERLQPKIIRVIERGLNRSAGMKNNLTTVKLIADMDHHEASLALKEEELDLTKADRSELIGTLAALLEDPTAEAALEGIIEGTAEDITEDQATENQPEGSGNGSVPLRTRDSITEDNPAAEDEGRTAGRTEPAASGHREVAEAASDAGEAAGNGRGAPASHRPARINPWVAAAKGGSGE